MSLSLFPSLHRSAQSVAASIAATAALLISAPALAAYSGTHDAADCNNISGWAYDNTLPSTPINVDIYDGSTLLTTVAAGNFRQDLLNAGIGNGYHGFSIATPASVMNSVSHTITIKYGGTATNLNLTPKTINCIGPGNPVISGDSAKFISQSVPATMAAGQTYAVTVTMQNNGTTTWSEPNLYRLGPQNPQDTNRWGITRVVLPASNPTVATGGTVAFSFNVTAPITPGLADFQWRMVHDGVAWFGDFSTNVAVTVVKADQTITFGALPSRNYGDAPFTVSAAASSALPVTFSSTTTAICTVSGATVTLVAPGNCTIAADQAGNASYNPAPQVTQSFTVKAAQTITGFAPATPIIYSPGGTFALSATGGASGNPVTFASTTPAVCSVAGSTATMLGGGTCTLTANQAGNASYSAAPQVTANVVINPTSQAITFNALPNKDFSTTPFPVSATASSGLTVSFTSSTQTICTVAGSSVTMLTVGLCTLVADQAGNASYNAAPQVTQSFTITSSVVVYYVHPDHLGTPRAVTTSDASNTKVWEWKNDDPFGNSAADENPSGLGTFEYNLRFPGQYRDVETGTNYNYFRDYDPSIGRYVQSDRLGLLGGINTYAYVGGNPLSFIDPFGLAPGANKAQPGGNSHDRRQSDRHGPKKLDDPNKQTKDGEEFADRFSDTVKCYFGFRACEAEEEIAKTRKCVKFLCKGTCPEREFVIDTKLGLQHAYDPATTKCACIEWGWNYEYEAGPLPGLKAPGK